MDKSYRELKVWQKAFTLVKLAYDYTNQFPAKEDYRLTSQMCRAAISITGNIAEGSCRSTDKDYARFLYISRGSAAELENYVLLSAELGYLTQEQSLELQDYVGQVGRMLNSLINYLETGKKQSR